jgi:hypothetical protein
VYSYTSHTQCFPPLIFYASGRSMRVFKEICPYLSCRSSRSIFVALMSSSSGLISSFLRKVQGSNSNTNLFFHLNVRQSLSPYRLYGGDHTSPLTKLLKFGCSGLLVVQLFALCALYMPNHLALSWFLSRDVL